MSSKAHSAKFDAAPDRSVAERALDSRAIIAFLAPNQLHRPDESSTKK
jgi:hypothetical protein